MIASCFSNEPVLHVGIIDANTIRFTIGETTHRLHYLGERMMEDECGQKLEEYRADEPFTLHDVTIGKQFHWEQQEDQTFSGKLHIIAAEGQLHAINEVLLEDYLASVISSEMAATNNLQLLKTHAIISRSWVLRQIMPSETEADDVAAKDDDVATKDDDVATKDDDVAIKTDAVSHDVDAVGSASTAVSHNADAAKNDADCEEIIKWWDHDDHHLYDVCADDHCQRYQGITRQVSPLVAQAIAATRGMVLTDNTGRICDARFYKACGGHTERFSACWQNRDYHYLTPTPDPYCDPAFIATLPGGLKGVLSEILNNYDQSTVDYHNWEEHFTFAELSELVERKLHLALGEIKDLVVLERGDSGRIMRLKIVGKIRSVIIGKELLIRKALSESHLKSSWFDIEKTADGFVLRGHGWGHGVGLCQIGAAAMSIKGFSYQQILAHYFLGSTVEQLYE